jgi:hypothetical protein
MRTVTLMESTQDEICAVQWRELGKNFSRKFWLCFLFECLLVIVPIAAFFGLAGVLYLLGVSEELSSAIIVGSALVLVVVYLTIGLWIFITLPRWLMRFRPFPGAKNASTQEVVGALKETFVSAEKGGKKVFDVETTGNKARITWSVDVLANQLLSVSGIEIKHIFLLTFREKKRTVKLVQRDVSTNWIFSWRGLLGGFHFSQGVFSELDWKFIPSVVFSEHGIRFDVKTIRYNSNEIVKTIMYIAASNGWTVEFGML